MEKLNAFESQLFEPQGGKGKGGGKALKNNEVWKIAIKFLHLHVHVIKLVKIVRHHTNFSLEYLAKAA